MTEKIKSAIEQSKKCAAYEDGCEEWAGCPCVNYKEIKNEECRHWTDEKCLYYDEPTECHHCGHKEKNNKLKKLV